MELRSMYVDWSKSERHDADTTALLLTGMLGQLKRFYVSGNSSHWHHRLFSVFLAMLIALVIFVVGVIFIFRYDPASLNKFNLIFGIIMSVVGFVGSLTFIAMFFRYQYILKHKYSVLQWLNVIEHKVLACQVFTVNDKVLNETIAINGLLGTDWILQLDRRSWIKIFMTYNNLIG